MARTRACKKCGEVIFYINSIGENTELICDKCRAKQSIYSGKYITCDKTCSSCYNDSFRVKVVSYGDDEKVTLECTECKGSPRIYYIDREGNSIDRNTREMLIIENKIDDIDSNASKLESKVYEIEYKSECVEENLERLNSRINSNKEDMISIEQDVEWISKELDREICKLKKEINELNNILKKVKENIKEIND